MVKINGEMTEAVGEKLESYLEAHGYKPATIAVEINEEIIPKCDYGKTIFQEGDVVEIVSFVGGG